MNNLSITHTPWIYSIIDVWLCWLYYEISYFPFQWKKYYIFRDIVLYGNRRVKLIRFILECQS